MLPCYQSKKLLRTKGANKTHTQLMSSPQNLHIEEMRLDEQRGKKGKKRRGEDGRGKEKN